MYMGFGVFIVGDFKGLFDGLFYSLQYILLGAYAGAITNVIGMFRTFLFSKKGKNKFFQQSGHYLFLYLYM